MHTINTHRIFTASVQCKIYVVYDSEHKGHYPIHHCTDEYNSLQIPNPNPPKEYHCTQPRIPLTHPCIYHSDSHTKDYREECKKITQRRMRRISFLKNTRTIWRCGTQMNNVPLGFLEWGTYRQMRDLGCIQQMV